ncbi:MAG: serine/threonine-protein kinase, partial [Polyangiaceae bacterium]
MPSEQTLLESHTFDDAPRPVTSAGPLLRQALDPKIALLEERGFSNRYVAQDLLGTGGMGEVRLHRDARIGRGVAMKMIRADKEAGPNVQARFLREARVQGQLEHPSIVPVYDVGVGPDGVLYFTMKRVHGLTFADIFTRLRAHDSQAEGEFSLRKLLAAFGSVCLAIEFAHTRSVVHRDLKPSNVMLGHFGEVYVLDWGVAKILQEDEDDAPRSSRATGEGDDLTDSGERNGVTAQGDFVGTPGFFSPEQLDNKAVDGRSDVYALGAILFQMLTLIPLHKGKLGQIMKVTK